MTTEETAFEGVENDENCYPNQQHLPDNSNAVTYQEKSSINQQFM